MLMWELMKSKSTFLWKSEDFNNLTIELSYKIGIAKKLSKDFLIET